MNSASRNWREAPPRARVLLHRRMEEGAVTYVRYQTYEAVGRRKVAGEGVNTCVTGPFGSIAAGGIGGATGQAKRPA